MAWFFGKKKEIDPEPTEQEATEQVADPEPAGPATSGPWDEADQPDKAGLLDAGSLLIPLIAGTTLQFSLDARTKQPLGVVFLKNDSALQVQAFAAPRSAGIWDTVRVEMMTSIAKQGGSSTEQEGPFGTELRAQMPVPNSNSFAPHRFIGVDGPRWLLRATIYGRAGSDDQAAAEMIEIFRKIVVVRGQNPYPPRELLPLEIPQPSKAAAAGADSNQG
ncbi:MAG: DUF3710 domain-containing protein [Trueperella sp.]|nr:DUF3710 domain-containing protein [Trueperella sp.]